MNIEISNNSIDDVQSTRGLTLLRLLIKSAENRAKVKDKRGFRYEDILKLFSAYIFLVCGPILYVTLAENLALPSRSTILRIIHETKPVVDAECRSKELKIKLTESQSPLKVWISKDVTRCIGKVQYNPKTNELIGLVLPTDENSMPIACSFLADSIEQINAHHENNPLSTYLYVYMAQPLAVHSPSFCLSIFGTDNKFQSPDSWNRLKYIIEKVEEGIEVWGDASDGDSRLLKVYRIQAGLGLLPNFSRLNADLPENFLPGFHAKVLPNQIPIQDPTHVAGNLRNRALKPSIFLLMGNFVVSSAHLEMLMDYFTRDKHYLTEKDLSPKDKMNFRSVLRFCDPRVRKLLEDNNPASQGTQEYLKVMYNVTNSYLSKELSILDRIYYLWNSTFFLRYWRTCILENYDHQLQLKNNFITLNSYVCIEINAHGLLNMIFRCMENNDFTTFLTWFLGSQACESFFRDLRSMSTTLSTVVNVSVLEAMQKLRRNDLQEYITTQDFEKFGEKLFFPRTKHLHANYEELSKFFHSMINYQ